MAFNITPNVDLQRDQAGRVSQITHIFEPYRGPDEKPEARDLTAAYVEDVADLYGIDRRWLDNVAGKPAERPQAAETELRLGEEKELHGTVTIAYAQTYAGIPVWQAGLAVVLQRAPLRVVSSHSTLHEKVDAPAPDEASPFSPDRIDEPRLAGALGLDRRGSRGLKIHSRRWRVYRYRVEQRVDGEIHPQSGKASAPPTLALPKPGQIEDGRHYFVTEVLFALPSPWARDAMQLNWRAFVDVRTGTVLYLRALVECVDGRVFARDPQSRSNDPAVVALASDAELADWRQTVTLPGLTAPAAGAEQALTGNFVTLSNIQPPAVTATTRPVGTDFDFEARSDGFAATNAYYHVDGLFRLMESMGFTIAGDDGYFDGTTFPVPVDHRGETGNVQSRCLGDAEGDGVGGMTFGPCVAGTTVGMCTEFQTVAHEFGHALLFDAVNSPNFGFCHSAGDSLGVILNDVDTTLTGAARFQIFPWCPIGGADERFCNRDVAAGWAWGGDQDDRRLGMGRGYGSEQILATTLFRVYRVTGGDSPSENDVIRRATRLQAARYCTYLIFRSIGALATDPVTATPNVGVYATALMNADTGTVSFDGFPGGTHNKVLRWSFERQGWYQPAGVQLPIAAPGAPPPVDVYIDDGRAGGYEPYLVNFWETTEIWNVTAANPATTPADHMTPILNVPNFLYVRVRNRGTEAANNVVVRAYHNRPATSPAWPGNWQATTTPMLPAPGSPALSIPANGMITVGPFRWTPRIGGHETLLVWVSADGDRANIDPATGFACARGPIQPWRFVPFDNNVAQRTLAPAPGSGAMVMEALDNRGLWIESTKRVLARIHVEIEFPPFLKRLGWGATIAEADAKGGIRLKGGERREVHLSLHPGKDFTEKDVAKAKERRIRVRTIVDGVITGGMSFELDPGLTQPPREHR